MGIANFYLILSDICCRKFDLGPPPAADITFPSAGLVVVWRRRERVSRRPLFVAFQFPTSGDDVSGALGRSVARSVAGLAARPARSGERYEIGKKERLLPLVAHLGRMERKSSPWVGRYQVEKN